MQGEPAAAEASVTWQQSDAGHVFSRASCPCITGPWQWRAAKAPRRKLAHRVLGGCSSSLSISCPFLVSALIATAHACLWSSFRWCSESLTSRTPKQWSLAS